MLSASIPVFHSVHKKHVVPQHISPSELMKIYSDGKIQNSIKYNNHTLKNILVIKIIIS
jgi:hypothetical protein